VSGEEWGLILLRLRRAIDDGISFGSTVKKIRDGLIEYLGIEKNLLHHPEIGPVKIKIVTGKAKHSNISVNMTPKFLDGWSNKKLLLSYGQRDANGHQFSLMKAIKFDDDKIKLSINEEKIELLCDCKAIGHWELAKITEKFRTQSTMLLCSFENRGENIITLSTVKLVQLETRLFESDFKQLIVDNHISPEFRMYIGENHEHCIQRAIPPGTVRDHGFSWRLKANLNSPLYHIETILR